MASTPGGGKKANSKKAAKSETSFETFPPPPLDMQLETNTLCELALKNDYQTLCGAYDTKDHPLSLYIQQEGLFQKRLREYSMKTPLELACSIGNTLFILKLLERQEKLMQIIDLNDLLKKSNVQGYTLLHYACLWSNFDLCKLFVFNNSIGNYLLKSKTINNETPKQIAKRYGHEKIVSFLESAELRQDLIDKILGLKETIASDARFNKDDKKKMDKLQLELLEWLEKCKNSENEFNVGILLGKSNEINELFKPFYEKLSSNNPTPNK